jgi:hypothetical protein
MPTGPSLRWTVELTRQLAGLRLGVRRAVRAGEPAAEPGLPAELIAAAPRVAVAAQAARAGRGRVDGRQAAARGRTDLRVRLPRRVRRQPLPALRAAGPGRAEGIEPTDEVAAWLSAFGPEQVGRSVERQLSRSPEHAGTLARAFAVLGRAASLRHSRDPAGLPAGLSAHEAARSADQLCAVGLFDRDGDRYTLVNPLVASALYHRVPAAERLWRCPSAWEAPTSSTAPGTKR